MKWVAGGTFAMGPDNHYPEEAPAHPVTVEGYWIDAHAVTNDQFRNFVEATGYDTLAERRPDPDDYPGAPEELLDPASSVFVKPTQRVSLDNSYNWWALMPGAQWRHPQCPGSTLDGRSQYPVVHVAWQDVEAYAGWADKEIPTEAEWEFAARGGLEGATFAWGEEFTPDGHLMANTWQGEFPFENTLDDGYAGTAPGGSFPPNGYGLSDMIGNVWEWTSDWYGSHERSAHSCCSIQLPEESARDLSIDRSAGDIEVPRKTIKGGSYLCAPNYCQRYRPAARTPQHVDTSTSHLGFRCVVRA